MHYVDYACASNASRARSLHRAPLSRPMGLVLACLLAGCAGNAYFAKSVDEIRASAPIATPAQAPAPTSKIVAIRWPALVTPRARPIIVKNTWSWIGVAYDSDLLMHDTVPLAAMPDIIESSSTFFAAELYWAIKRVDPHVQVLLEPQYVDANRIGSASLLPLTDTSIPADIVADLWVDTVNWAALAIPGTFLALQAAPARSRENCGLLLATIGNEPLPDAFERTTCTGPYVRNALQAHYFLDGEKRARPMAKPATRTSLPLSTKDTVLIKVGGMFDADDYLAKSRPLGLDDADKTAVMAVISAYAEMVVQGLRVIDPVESAPKTLASYARQFDSALAAALVEDRALSSHEKENLQLVRRLLQQEIKVRAIRDERIAREILAGQFGAQFRKARDEAKARRQQQMLSLFVTTLASAALHGVLLQSGGSDIGALAASNQTVDFFNQQTQQAGLEFARGVAPSLSSLGTATVSLMGDVGHVDVSDQAGLREALRAIYARHRKSTVP